MVTGPRADERGSVLVVVVLLSVAMFAVAHGLLLSARTSLTTARLGARLVESAAVSDGAVTEFVRQGPPPGADTVDVGQGWSVHDSAGSIPIEALWRRLDPEVWLVSARASTPSGWLPSGSRLVWRPDPLVRLMALAATVSLGPEADMSVAGPITNASTADERAEATPDLVDACAPVWAAWEADVRVAPPAIGVIAGPGLGPLDLAELLGRATVLPTARGTPGPRMLGGACTTEDAWNWGDPERPASPCAGHYVLMGSRTSLRVEGGVGQGVLLVDGDLDLVSGARFHGLVIVSGTVRMDDAATLSGFVVASDGLEMSGDAVVERSVCRAATALQGVRSSIGATTLHGALDFLPRW